MAGMGGVVVRGIGCCKEDWKEDSVNAVAYWREETGVQSPVSPEVDVSEVLWSHTCSCVGQEYCCLPFLGK